MDLSGSNDVSASDVTDTATTAPPKKPAPSKAERTKAAPKAAEADSKSVQPILYEVEVDRGRDSLLTEFGKDTLRDRYLLPGESYQDLFVRVASAYAVLILAISMLATLIYLRALRVREEQVA